MESTGFSYEEISAPYYFETDHVALKENSDYRNMLHTIALLEAQRQQAAKDIDTLFKAQADALVDPMAFVEKLQKGVDLALPKPQKIASLPDIQWDKYSTDVSFASFGLPTHMTRNKKSSADSGADSHMSRLKSKLTQGLSSSSLANTGGASGSDSDVVVVRGRAKDKSKPATFNQLWTDEEQKRLEQLLIQYPPEEVESRRWSKIADALGNRTPVQVASRVQKYFVRLAKEGLPIPGRMPNLSTYAKKGSHRHQRYNRLYYQSSTFMQSHTPPVWMKEEDDDLGSPFLTGHVTRPGGSLGGDYTPAISETTSTKDESSDDDDLPAELINTPEYQELQSLKRLKRELVAQQQTSATRHVGYKCDKCGCEPIIGTRWHCIDCPSEMSFDFCEKCSDSSFQKDKHDSSHRLHPYKHAVLDSDYMSNPTNDNYNYLDPNYMPAS